MASKLFGNSIRCPSAGWTMPGPGSHDLDDWTPNGAQASEVKQVLVLQEDLEKMADELLSNSSSCPDGDWTMLDPGTYGSDDWAFHGAEQSMFSCCRRSLKRWPPSSTATASAALMPAGPC